MNINKILFGSFLLAMTSLSHASVCSVTESEACFILPAAFKANFEQVFDTHKKDLKKRPAQKSSGELTYLTPGHLKIEVKSPDPEIVVSNPTTTWVYTPPFIEGEAGQVAIHQTKNFSPSKFFDLLVSGLKENKYYKVEKDQPLKEYKLLMKKEWVKSLKIKSAKLTFTNPAMPTFETLKSMDITYSDGKAVTISLLSVNTAVTPPKGDFEFVVPKGTQVEDNTKH